MKNTFLFIVFAAFTLSACSQGGEQKQGNDPGKGPKVGGGCEGCEAIHESPIPFDQLNWTDTLPDFNEPGPKLEISGIIYKADGKTPAPGVVLYIYHTDQEGNYSTKGNEKGWGKRHGYIRGWVKTNQQGQYQFYTLVPASYPNSNNPKHIHPTIKEPGMNEYWIDEYQFADDPLFRPSPKSYKPRGSNGVLQTQEKDGILRATRDIILGSNVPNYPES